MSTQLREPRADRRMAEQDWRSQNNTHVMRDETRSYEPQTGKWAFRCVIAGAVIVVLLAILEMLP